MNLVYFFILLAVAVNPSMMFETTDEDYTLNDDDGRITAVVEMAEDGILSLSCEGSGSIERVYIVDDVFKPTVSVELGKGWYDNSQEECVQAVERESLGDWSSVFENVKCAGPTTLKVDLKRPVKEKSLKTWYCYIKEKPTASGAFYFMNKILNLTQYAMKNLRELGYPTPLITSEPDFSTDEFITLACGVPGVELPDVSGPLKSVRFFNEEIGFSTKGDLYGRDSYISYEYVCNEKASVEDEVTVVSSIKQEILPMNIISNCYNAHPSDFRSELFISNFTAFIDSEDRHRLYTPEKTTYDLQLTDLLILNPKSTTSVIDFSHERLIAFKMFDLKDLGFTPIVSLGDKTYRMSERQMETIAEQLLYDLEDVSSIQVVEYTGDKFTCTEQDKMSIILLERDCSFGGSPFKPEDTNCTERDGFELNFQVKVVDGHEYTPACNSVSKYAICIKSDKNLEVEGKVINSLYSLETENNLEFGSYQHEVFNEFCLGQDFIVVKESDYINTLNEKLKESCYGCSYLSSDRDSSFYDRSLDIANDELSEIKTCAQKINSCTGKHSNRFQATIKVPYDVIQQGGQWVCEIFDMESAKRTWYTDLSGPLACSGDHINVNFVAPPKLIKQDKDEDTLTFTCGNLDQQCVDLGASGARELKFYSEFGDNSNTEYLDDTFLSYDINRMELIKNYDQIRCSSFGNLKINSKPLSELYSNEPCDTIIDCAYDNSESLLHCYYAQNEFCTFPKLYVIYITYGNNPPDLTLKMDYNTGVEDLYKDDLVHMEIQVIQTANVTFTLKGYNDILMEDEVFSKDIVVTTDKTVGYCEHGGGETIQIKSYSDDKGNVRLTCADESFDKPGCTDPNEYNRRVYHMSIMAFDGETMEEVRDGNGQWKDIVGFYRTYGENHTIEWSVSTETDKDYLSVYSHEWYKQFSYKLTTEEIAKVLSEDKPVLVAKCSKLIGGMGEEVSDYTLLEKPSVIFQYNRLLLESQATTTTTTTPDIEIVSTTKKSEEDDDNSNETEEVRETILIVLIVLVFVTLIFVGLLSYALLRWRNKRRAARANNNNYVLV